MSLFFLRCPDVKLSKSKHHPRLTVCQESVSLCTSVDQIYVLASSANLDFWTRRLQQLIHTHPKTGCFGSPFDWDTYKKQKNRNVTNLQRRRQCCFHQTVWNHRKTFHTSFNMQAHYSSCWRWTVANMQRSNRSDDSQGEECSPAGNAFQCKLMFKTLNTDVWQPTSSDFFRRKQGSTSSANM